MNALARLGWRVLRVTWWDLQHRPSEIIAEIADALRLTDHLSGDTAEYGGP